MKTPLDKAYEAMENEPLHLPVGKEAYGFFVHQGKHLPVVRSAAPIIDWATLDSERSVVDIAWAHSYTVWQNGVAWTENFSQRDWDRLKAKGEAYEVAG